MYLSWRVKQFGGAAKFIELARDVNAAMPLYCVARVQDLLNDRSKPLRGARVLVLGVAYKRDISDVRESPALPFLAALLDKGCDVVYCDPYVPVVRLDDGRELTATELDDDLVRSSDCVVVFTDHSAVDHDHVAEVATLVFDTRNVVRVGGDHVERL
jgi:UDP-N-acetyl-D-glucosamine dehydrogenase